MTISKEKEQRISERFGLRCLVTFAEEEQGWSRDISSTGIYLSTQRNLNAKEVIGMTITFSRESVIRCEGEVIRTEKQENGYGVAIQFKTFLFGK